MKYLITLILIVISNDVFAKARYDGPYQQDSIIMLKEGYFRGIHHIFPYFSYADNQLVISYIITPSTLKNNTSLFNNIYKTDSGLPKNQFSKELGIEKRIMTRDYNFGLTWRTAFESDNSAAGFPKHKFSNGHLVVHRGQDLPPENEFRYSDQLIVLDNETGRLSDSTKPVLSSLHRLSDISGENYYTAFNTSRFDLNYKTELKQNPNQSNRVISKYDNELNLIWRKYVLDKYNSEFIAMKKFGDTLHVLASNIIYDSKGSSTFQLEREILDSKGKTLSVDILLKENNIYGWFNNNNLRFSGDFDQDGNFYFFGLKDDSTYFKENYPELKSHESNFLFKFDKSGDLLWKKIVDFDRDTIPSSAAGFTNRRYEDIHIDEFNNIMLYGRAINFDKNLNNLLFKDNNSGFVIKTFSQNGDFISNIFLHDKIMDPYQIIELPRQKYLVTGRMDPINIPIEEDNMNRTLTPYFIIGLPDLKITHILQEICSGTRQRIEYEAFPENSFKELIVEVSDIDGSFENSSTFETEYDDFNTVFFEPPLDLDGERKIRLISNEIDTYSDIYETSITFTSAPECIVLEQTEIACNNKTYTYNTEAGFNNFWSVNGGKIIGSNKLDSVRVEWTRAGLRTLSLRQRTKIGCENTAEYKINIEDEPIFESNLEGNTETLLFCQNDPSHSFTIFSPLGGNYLGEGISENIIDPSEMNPGLYSGTYSLEYGDKCESSTFFEYEIMDVPDKPEILESEGVLRVKSDNTVYWYTENDLETPIFEGKEFEPSFSSEYYAVLQNEFGCYSELSEGYGIILSIRDVEGLDVDLSNGIINIRSNNLIESINIYDLEGRVIYQDNNAQNIKYEFKSSGIYFIEINNNIYKINLGN